MNHTITSKDVNKLFKEIKGRGIEDSKEVLQALRTEVHALLQLQCPFPGTLPAPVMTNRKERGTELKKIRSEVTDAQRLASEKARIDDPNHTDTHHFLQKEHGTALWNEADRLIATTLGLS